MNPHRINSAMRDCHGELLSLGSFSAKDAHTVIARTTGLDLASAGVLFMVMRVMNYIEEYHLGGFRAVRKYEYN